MNSRWILSACCVVCCNSAWAQVLDYGDLPDSSYPTKLIQNGARHTITPNLYLGTTAPDADADGHANANAAGDDADATDDEDAVDPDTLLITAGMRYNLRMKATNHLVGNATLTVLADWNHDGDFDDGFESTKRTVFAGSTDAVIVVPLEPPVETDTASPTALRLRLSTASNLGGQGLAPDGEVEDYLITVHQPGELKDFGDLPDAVAGTHCGEFFTAMLPDYKTRLADGGPSHGIVPELNFSNVGSSVDAELDGQPNSNATGDDVTHDPDEAGMVITTTSVAFKPDGLSSYFDLEQFVELPVTNITGAQAKIGVFIDVNGDGDFDDTDEQFFETVPGDGSVIIRGTTIKFKVPAAPPAMIFTRAFAVRCRITTDAAVGPDGPATDGEVIDSVQQLQFGVPPGGYDALDMGDLPSPFPTLRANNGGRHVITPEIFLGTAAPDGEPDGQPSSPADGDDANGVDDENAINVTSLHPVRGFLFTMPVLLTNLPKNPATLSGFVDWNGDGDFDDAGESNFKAVPQSVSGVIINLPFTVPLNASITGPIAVRLRLAASGPLPPIGAASSGEVEDYYISVQAQGIDWGDLPDSATGTGPGLFGTASPPNYKTLSADGGPSHIMDPNVYFLNDVDPTVPSLDAENDGEPANNADSDQDEGPVFFSILSETVTNTDGIHVDFEVELEASLATYNTTGSVARVSCFIDVNSDGDFDDAGEQAPVVDVPDGTTLGAVLPKFTFPLTNLTAPRSYTMAVRSRISTDAGLTSNGPASNGEVDDSLVSFNIPYDSTGLAEMMDYGDLNAARYPTLWANNGARHVITQTLFMGINVPDGEPDANASLTANGDDTNGGDDEDGFNPAAVIPLVNQPVDFPVMVSNASITAATLYGFVDWNDDGDFADADETSTAVVPAGAAGSIVMLPWTVPASASTLAPVAVRLRLSHDATLGPMGRASDGEVEDYLIDVYPGLDFGDLPAPYATVLAAGARHLPDANLYLGGSVPDIETDGHPSALADGDDLDGADDEDALIPASVNAATSFPTVLPVKATNLTAIPARLFVFVDWNADGDFLDSSESNTVIVPPASVDVTINVPFVVPGNASVAPHAIAVRLRLSTGVALGPNGFALDGEVEDSFISAHHLYDFGDLPDSATTAANGTAPGVVTNTSTVSQGDYQTLLIDDGPRHIILPDLVIFNDANPPGIHIDPDSDGYPSVDAKGDDNDANDDEELLLTAIIRQAITSTTATTAEVEYDLFASLSVKNETGVDAYLTGFLDANNDGDFADPGETMNMLVPSAAGFATQTLTFTPKVQLTKPTTTWTTVMPIRLRLSTLVGLTSCGPAPDGEVEDYMVTVNFATSDWWTKILGKPVFDFHADSGTPLQLHSNKLPPFFQQTNGLNWHIGPATLQGFDPVIGTGLLSSLGFGMRGYSVSTELGPQTLASYSGLIQISSLSDYRDYMSQHNITGTIASPDEDADGDGTSNFIEFAFGADPGVVSLPPAMIPKVVIAEGGQSFFTGAYLRRLGGTSTGATYDSPDVTYRGEGSNNLLDWIKPVTGAAHFAGLPLAPADYEWGAVRLVEPISADPAGFLRLHVSPP